MQCLHDNIFLEKKLIDCFTQITPKEFQLLFDNSLQFGLILLEKTFFDESFKLREDLSKKQKKSIKRILTYYTKSYEAGKIDLSKWDKSLSNYDLVIPRLRFQRLVEEANKKEFNKKLDYFL